MNGFTALLYRRDFGGPVALPNGASLEPLRYAWAAIGGPAWAVLALQGRSDAVAEALGWLRCGVEVSAPGGEPVWWGYVHSVQVGVDDGVRLSAALEGMANRVAALYRTRVPGDVPQYRDVLTPWAEDAESVAEFGAKERILRPGAVTEAEAVAARDTELAQHRLPITGAALSGAGAANGSGAAATCTAWIYCRGWYDTLDWRYYAQSAGLEESPAYNATQKLGLGKHGATIGFVARSGAIGDVAGELAGLDVGDRVVICGSAANDGVYTVWQATARPAWRYTRETISFVAVDGGVWRIVDALKQLGGLERDDFVQISGSHDNDGLVRVESAAADGASIDVWQPLTTEPMGALVTLVRGHSVRVREALHDEMPGANVTLAAYGTAVAQTFTLAGETSWRAGRVALRAGRTGAPVDALRVRVCADAGGAPGTVLAEGVLPSILLGPAPAWLEVALTPAATLVPHQVYWLAVERTGGADAVNHYRAAVDENCHYERGSAYVYGQAAYVPRDPGASLAFQVLGEQDGSEQVCAIVAGCGQLLAGTHVVERAGVTVGQYRPGYATGLAEIARLLTATEGQRRLLPRVERDRVLRLGAADPVDTVRYRLDSGGRLLLEAGGRAGMGVCPAGAWVALDDAPGNAGISRYGRVSPFWVEHAAYDCRTGRLRLGREPLAPDGIALGAAAAAPAVSEAAAWEGAA
jgi:ketosteroid isomerase-like protein